MNMPYRTNEKLNGHQSLNGPLFRQKITAHALTVKIISMSREGLAISKLSHNSSFELQHARRSLLWQRKNWYPNP